MDEDLARIMISAGLRAGSELTALLSILAQHLPDDEALRLRIAAVLADIGSNVLEPAFVAHPDLREEWDRRIDKYGRA